MATDHQLRLNFESINSLPQGSNEVRLYHDEILDCDRVGKRFDLSLVEATVLPEASTLQSIRHPNVLEVVSAARVGGYADPLMQVIEVITPYYPQGSITDALLRGERFPGPLVLSIMRNALRGIRELHTGHGILHRDLKSGNILLTEAPIYALIADLGVAGRMDEAGFAPAVKNPTLYSPPELLTTGNLSAASDLYPLGHIMRELLGGPFPYDKYSREQVVESLRAGRNPLSHEDAALPVWVPSRLRKIHAKVTASDPKKRYQSAREMGRDLDTVSLADWHEVAASTWDVAPTSLAAPTYQVGATKDVHGHILSIKKYSGTRLRRPQGFPDAQVSGLADKEARKFFDASNALVLR